MRRGFSLIEVLMCLLILSTIVVPIIDMVITSRRVSHSASRSVDVTLHAQTVLEAVSHLEPKELPEIAADGERMLLADGIRLPPGGGDRFKTLESSFQRPPPVPMTRRVSARRLATGELALRIKVSYLAVVGEERTRQEATFRMLTIPWSWTR